MKKMSTAKVLRFYVSNTDTVNHVSVYEKIAYDAKKFGLAGATVFKGVMGYGLSSKLRSDKFWEIIEKVPVVVEIIDEEEKIDHFLEMTLPWLKTLPKGCLVTCQDTLVILAKEGNKKTI